MCSSVQGGVLKVLCVVLVYLKEELLITKEIQEAVLWVLLIIWLVRFCQLFFD